MDSRSVIIHGFQSRRMADGIDHTFEIGQDIGVPKADNAIALPQQLLRTLTILHRVGIPVVLPAIKLHDQLATMASKIGDVSGERNLPAEVAPFLFHHAQFLPELSLGIGGVVTKGPRAKIRHR